MECEGQAGLHQAGREPQGFQAKGGHSEHRGEGKSVYTRLKGQRGSKWLSMRSLTALQ